MQKQTWDDFGDILTALEETWPAVARHTMDPWIIRDGQGGGKRVSAATPNSYWTQADIQAAETAMQDLGCILFCFKRFFVKDFSNFNW